MLKLRGHHVLCTLLFEGKGYESTFAEKMAETVGMLPHEEIMLISGYDRICEGCPNKNDVCPERCLDERVSRKDRHIMELLGATDNDKYSYSTLAELVKDRISEEMFINTCQNCIWFTEGVCTHKKLISSAEKYMEVI